jgi:hypothetical protein
VNIDCPVCGKRSTEAFEERARTPVLLNHTYESPDAARAARCGQLSMRCCNRCGFVWNASFDDALITYDGEYENDQTFSDSFRDHVRDMAERVIALVPSHEPIDLLEIGAGQGKFIGTVAELAGPRLRSAHGFDPAWRGAEGAGPNGARMFANLFGADTSRLLTQRPNIVVSRHTIEHVAQPRDFLARIASGLGPGAPVHFGFETPCVQWIVDNGAFQDFFFEHCSLFTADSLRACLLTSQFGASSILHVFGGQYLWAEGLWPSTPAPATSSAVPGVSGWRQLRAQWTSRWTNWLDEHGARGPVYVWGAGAKGVTFTLLLDPEAKRFAGLIDVNPRKQGRFVPLSGHAILAPLALSGRKVSIVVMNPNYLEEIGRECERLGVQAELAVL